MNFKSAWLTRCLLGAALLGCAAQARAADAKSGITPEQMFEGGTNTFNNWIELSAGGMLTRRDAGQAEQRQHMQKGAFGGIEDLHLQENLDKKTVFTLDGHSIFDQHDYSIRLGVNREDTGYVRFSFENFRTWYDSAGGFFPLDGLHYTLGNDALGVDRGEISFEAGLTLKNAPKVTFKYTHRYREGEKSSTAWGEVDTSIGTRSLYPAFYDLNEKSDSFQLDVTHHIKATELGLGVRYEMGTLNDALKTFSFATDPDFQRRITDRQGTTYDLVSVHAFSETWLKKNLFFSAGFMFANLDDTFSGSRIYGEDFDVGFTQDPLNGLGYYALNGGAHKQEYVLNLNLMSIPVNSLTIVPSIRAQDENWNADSSGIGLLGDFPSEPFSSRSDRDLLEVRERVDVRYTGVTNWVFYGGPEWTEGQGNLTQNGGLSQINGIGVPPVQRETDDSHLFQKYFVGARWYPTRRLTIELGGYYKNNRYDYTHETDSTLNTPASPDRYPGFLQLQDFQTKDGNLRVTLRPLQNLTLVSRYEFQYSTVHTMPDPVSDLAGVDASKVTSHIIGENISWTPWTRLSLQIGGNVVISDTKTPASDYTQAVLRSENNYWTVNFNAGLVLDNKTDLNLGYFFYQADDFQDNSTAGLPLGVASTEHGVTAGLTRRLTQNLRLNVKYGYSHFADAASGGNNSYEAHVLFSSLQYRF